MTSPTISNNNQSVTPSVYVAYHNLVAYVSCPSGAPLARGRSYNTTVAYAPEELSTALSARSQETECTYATVNYTMLGDYSSSGDPNFFLSIPSSLTTQDPAWSTCTPVLYGAWDPPSTLSTATALTSSAQETVQLQFATPVGRPTPAYAPATTVTAAGDPANSNSWDQPIPGAPRMSSLSRTDAEEAPETSLIGMSSLILASSRGPTMVALPLLAGESITWDPNDGLLFADSTIAFGGQATISGHAISLGTSDAVIDSSTYALSAHTAEDENLPLVTLPDGTVASYMNGPDEVKIGSRTVIVQGSAITISGTAISLGNSGLYIDSSFLTLTYSTKNLNASLDGPPVSQSYKESNSVSSGNSSSSEEVFTSGSQRSMGLSLINTNILTITIAITIAIVLVL